MQHVHQYLPYTAHTFTAQHSIMHAPAVYNSNPSTPRTHVERCTAIRVHSMYTSNFANTHTDVQLHMGKCDDFFHTPLHIAPSLCEPLMSPLLMPLVGKIQTLSDSPRRTIQCTHPQLRGKPSWNDQKKRARSRCYRVSNTVLLSQGCSPKHCVRTPHPPRHLEPLSIFQYDRSDGDICTSKVHSTSE